MKISEEIGSQLIVNARLNIGTKAALLDYNLTTIAELFDAPDKELLMIKGIGRRKLTEIRLYLTALASGFHDGPAVLGGFFVVVATNLEGTVPQVYCDIFISLDDAVESAEARASSKPGQPIYICKPVREVVGQMNYTHTTVPEEKDEIDPPPIPPGV